ncbi:TonB-dependent receptor [Novosphingobium ovatum]|uniref:TonB-dependent receptor n=1 Tax=Novosphingobium ovatum TaxID=1908523 RepID=UPI0029FF31ED|nr:TonB-dependent receptor [Novosphingobium ovatum]
MSLRPLRSRPLIPALFLAALAPVAAHADDAPAPAPVDAAHLAAPAEIVVTGALSRSRQDVLSGVAVLSGAHLDQVLRASVGETLAHVPGVSATSFGPTASRPVLRGMQGERVRLLVDGIGSIDVSNTSADHAPAVNPLLAERIEVLRGPQSLLYGSAAIGGVVNVIDRRIPTRVPDEAVHVDAIATYGTAARERSFAGSAEAPLGGGFVAHVDGSRQVSGDQAIPGHAMTPALRAQALATAAAGTGNPDIDYAANANVSGHLPNSAASSWAVGGGLAYVNDHGNIGIAYSHTDSLYGVPLRFATLPDQDQEAPRIAMVQDRVDLRAEVKPATGLFDKLALRVGNAAYHHFELDDTGAIGTRFFNHGTEARFEASQRQRGGWRGASGVQFVARDFDVQGDEAFLPKNTTRQLGLFSVQEVALGHLTLEAGARYEHSSLTALPTDVQPQFWAGTRRYDTLSFSGGAAYQLTPLWKLAVNVSRNERAPSAEELFANGPHAGTQSYELGDTGLKTERATSVEAILRGGNGDASFEASVYHSWFANFIYDTPTGDQQDGLPVYAYAQGAARYYGFELQGKATIARFGAWRLAADAMADAVWADITGVGPAPRIPPLRLLGGVELTSAAWDIRAEVERVTAQNRVAANETATPGYTMVNAQIGWRPWGQQRPVSITLGANNLLNVDARRHASLMKDYAPLAGRDFRLSVRVSL